MIQTGFLDRSVQVDGTEALYSVYLPRGYDPAKPLPAILFLHGMGESGTDGAAQLTTGLPMAIMRARHRWPFLVVMPQKATKQADWWSERGKIEAILKATDAEFKTDPHRRYLTGLSQGGHGAFRLAKQLSWQFAAIAPVCGWVDPDTAARELKDIPLWAFHGERDTVVRVEGTTKAIEAIRAAGGDPKLTLYPELAHNSWDAAYQESPLAEWFLKHTLE